MSPPGLLTRGAFFWEVGFTAIPESLPGPVL